MFYSEKALKVTGNSGLQAALDWLEVNGENESAFSATVTGKGEEKTCLMCNECKKRFKSLEQAELHAARTLHDDFIEAVYEEEEKEEENIMSDDVTPAPPVLTPEEKVARLNELRAKVAEKKAIREKELKESEVLRKASSKELEQIKRDMQAREMKKLAEERRMEKIADRQRREEIKKQIEEDRENKKRQIEAEKMKMSGISSLDTVPVNITPIIPVAATNSTSARIKIKLPAPQLPIQLTFESPATETFKDLRLRVETDCNKTNVTELMQTFPTRLLTMDADDEKTLNELGLSPSAILILK